MCNFKVTISQASQARTIACCQTNTIQLTWDYVALQLTYGEFARLVQQVDSTRVAVIEGFFEEDEQSLEPVTVNCRSFSLKLEQADYLQFAQMVTQAFEKLAGRAPRVLALKHGSHPLAELAVEYKFAPN